MIHIKENHLDTHTVAIDVAGVLDHSAVPVLKEVCDRYPENKILTLLNLEGVSHVTREGRRFLQTLDGKVKIINLPEFIRMEKVFDK